MDLKPAKGTIARLFVIVNVAFSLAFASPACAEGCPGNVSVDPVALRQVGTAQYARAHALGDHKVVLSFDDGPSTMPPQHSSISTWAQKWNRAAQDRRGL
jgi:hypothetical protein